MTVLDVVVTGCGLCVTVWVLFVTGIGVRVTGRTVRMRGSGELLFNEDVNQVRKDVLPARNDGPSEQFDAFASTVDRRLE